ncbi:unnamed protein product [Auanema sp. JU1783]|nr:unnamed protein product [Auanema sp. JU1783]
MSFQPAFNARLISEVKKHPCLYNHSKRGSGDTTERMKIWDQIAIQVDQNCTGEFAKKRWLQLRDRYRKELKVAIRQNFSQPVRWCYFSHLTWLDPYLKDNLALANACDTLSECLDYTNMDLSSLAQIKTEIDDVLGMEDNESNSVLYESSLDRVLAATHRHESRSPALENDESGPQSVGTSGDEDRADVATTTTESGGTTEERDTSTGSIRDNVSDPLLQILQTTPSASACFSIKDQFLARQVQQQQMAKHIYQQSAKSALDWMNDEDMLYARIIGLRLKRMDPKRRRKLRTQILSLLEDDELFEDDSGSPPPPAKCPKLEDEGLSSEEKRMNVSNDNSVSSGLV